MRRLVGLVVSGLGSFLIVIALLLHFFVVGQAVKYPLGFDRVTVLQGNNVSYFSAAKVTELSGVTMRVTNTTQGDVSAGTSSRAVWNIFSYIYDETNRMPYSYVQSRFAFDRRTGVLVNCCNAAVGNSSVKMSGQGPLFPFNTQKGTYGVFNTSTLRPEPAVYQSQATVDGLATYKFVQQIPATMISTQIVPGSLIGENKPNVTLGVFFQATNTYWVDPVTGGTVALSENEHVGLRDSSGAEKLVLFNGVLNTTPASVQYAVNQENSDDSKIHLISTILPLVGGLVGLVLLVFGAALFFFGREEQEEYADEEEYAPV